MESAKKVFNSNILSQPISTQETTKSKEKKQVKNIVTFFSFFYKVIPGCIPNFTQNVLEHISIDSVRSSIL